MPSLADAPLVSFVPSADLARARPFYEGTLGLPVRGDDGFALVFESAERTLRVVATVDFTPQPFTVRGWDVPDVAATVADLAARGWSSCATRTSTGIPPASGPRRAVTGWPGFVTPTATCCRCRATRDRAGLRRSSGIDRSGSRRCGRSG